MSEITEAAPESIPNLIDPLDFPKFDKLIRSKYGSYFKSEADFLNFKRNLVDQTKKGTCEPLVLTEVQGEIQVKDGYARLLAHQLLGITPLVRFE